MKPEVGGQNEVYTFLTTVMQMFIGALNLNLENMCNHLQAP